MSIVSPVFGYINSYFTVSTFILVQRKEALPSISVQPAQKEENEEKVQTGENNFL
jgi:hypothetical protein